MKKKYRLKRNEEISSLVKQNKKKKSKSFIVYYQDNEYDYSRICISVSKKLGNAVERNKIKRQVREMVKKCFSFQINKDYLIVVRKVYDEHNFQENFLLLKEVYQKINKI